MTTHDALECSEGCRCRHVWGSCDCPVCTDKRERMIERGDRILLARKLEELHMRPEPTQTTVV